jgi:YD repeat-containing protein
MELKRFPPGRGFLFFAKYVPVEGSYATLRWHFAPFNHFELERPDGAVEQYLPCGDRPPPCYLVGYRSSSGEQLHLERDAKRNLLSVSTREGTFLHLDYDSRNLVAAVTDNRGRTIHYAYDGEKRLTSVSYPSGDVLSYEYDLVHHLIGIYVAQNPNLKPKLVVRNEFENGFLTTQTYHDGRVFRYKYFPQDKQRVQTVVVTPPLGPTLQVTLYKSSSTVRELSK